MNKFTETEEEWKKRIGDNSHRNFLLGFTLFCILSMYLMYITTKNDKAYYAKQWVHSLQDEACKPAGGVLVYARHNKSYVKCATGATISKYEWSN